MRPKGTAAELERRRYRAVDLLELGEKPAVVARILGGKPTSLHRWRRMARHGQGLSAKRSGGAKRRLTDAQLRELEQILLKGAPSHGFPNELWTSARVAQIIQRYFGVKYHKDYVRRLLRRQGQLQLKPDFAGIYVTLLAPDTFSGYLNEPRSPRNSPRELALTLLNARDPRDFAWLLDRFPKSPGLPKVTAGPGSDAV
jgi:transposase